MSEISSTFPDQVFALALHLAPADREALAERLLQSLEVGAWCQADWQAEIERRVEELEQGQVKLIPAAEVLTDLANYLRSSQPSGG